MGNPASFKLLRKSTMQMRLQLRLLGRPLIDGIEFLSLESMEKLLGLGPWSRLDVR